MRERNPIVIDSEILKIFMKWCLESKEYDLVYLLYTEYGIGVPVKHLYTLPKRDKFSSIGDFRHNYHTHRVPSIPSTNSLVRLLDLFKRSQYTRLREWNHSFGYRFLEVRQ